MDFQGDHVAPLSFSKGGPQVPESNAFATRRPSTSRFPSGSSHVQMTPPLTPHSSREEIISRTGQDRSVFHNYLRAFYPFQPTGAVSDSTVTLPLDQGDIILVHSVHTNGWADGTLLDTGARGWLPTNYCEAYEPVAMKPLLKALTEFWDVIRLGSGSTLHQFNNQDYMLGLVAGVRFLLEKSECLKREADLLAKIDGLRRNRKALLSDMNSLAKLRKQLQEIANGGGAEEALDNILDQMLLKAFRIVTRGVRFLDVWNEEVGLSRAMAELERPVNDYGAYEAPLTPPADASFSSHATFASAGGDTDPSFSSSMTGPSYEQYDNNLSIHHQNHGVDGGFNSQQRPSSFQTKRVSVSHRISYNTPTSGVRNPNLASERLGTAYDGFLGVLGSFLGLHLQSRSSTELILTTQQAVQSCRALLSVVEAVCEHDMRPSEELKFSKDAMYEKISELVRAASDAFRPDSAAHEELVFMPDEGKRLVDAATDCVRGAGDCVARSKQVLEEIGDFEFEPVGLGISSLDTPMLSTTEENQFIIAEDETPPSQPFNDAVRTARTSSMRPPPPPLKIPNNEQFTPTLTDGTTPSSHYATNLQTPTSTIDEPMSCTLSSFGDLGDSFIPLDFSPDKRFRTPSPVKFDSPDLYHPDNRDTMSTQRDSEMSGVSQTSTRATTPDLNKPFPPLSNKASFQDNTPTVIEEAEESFLGKTYAHELILKDGQVMGGSLRGLIERLTAHQSTPDAMFVSTFYLTFRHFATPTEFAGALMERYEYVSDVPNIAGPVRLRVYNIFKGWLESHWRHDCDDVALPAILKFARTKLMVTLPTAGKRLIDLAEKVSDVHGPVVPRLVSSIGKTNTSVAQYVSPDVPLPTPILSKAQASLLKQWKTTGQAISITDFDPMEIARQLTLKESRIFCSILPEELLATEWTKKSASLAVNVRAMSTLSTDLANLVADCILHLEEPKKRAVVIKQWVKIAAKCLELNNYDSLMAIICSLNSSTLSRLKRTWELVSQKTHNTLEQLRQVVDPAKNYKVLRQRLQNHVPPTLPFVGTYLTDLTFVDHGNQNTRALPTDDGDVPLINFDKHMKTARIISELQRFQIPYRLAEVPELQTWIQGELVRVRSAGEMTFQNHYRRSLVLEPREQPGQRTPVEPTPPLFSLESAKDKFDFLAWTHGSKTKAIATTG